jgi:hypothetical protein
VREELSLRVGISLYCFYAKANALANGYRIGAIIREERTLLFTLSHIA